MDTHKDFAKQYLDIYHKSKEELSKIPWYCLGRRKYTKKRMRWANYHYRKLTKKQPE